ncbi:MAG: lysylphosphatidylglycerol synthase domain-containing protein, partial [Nakamurella sp.]
MSQLAEGRSRTSVTRIAIGAIVTVIAIGVGGYLVWDQIPPLMTIVDLLTDATPGWLLLALLAEVVAVVAFSVVQRRLVINLGGELSRRGSVELTLASGAISSALPAGAALGAGYTYRRMRRAGLRGSEAGTALVASAGILSGALVLLYLLLTGPSLLQQFGELIGPEHLGAVVVLVVAILVFLVVRTRISASKPPTEQPARPAPTTMRGRVADWIVTYVRTSRETFRAIPAPAWRISSVAALIKWLADFTVLVGATLAVGADVDFVSLATVYVGVQIIRQIPFTPGGIDIIEAALLA